jgi:hypothetical protein
MTTPSLPPRSSFGAGLRPIEDSDLARYGVGLDLDGDGDDDYDLDYEDYEPGLGDRLRIAVGHGLRRMGWLALAAGLAFGSAGIVAATEHLPSTGTRPELTWGADQQLSTRLDAAIRNLAMLNDDVDSLGQMARQTLTSLANVNQIGLQQAWDEGWNNVTAIDAGAADLNQSLGCPTWDAAMEVDLAKTYSPGMVDRYHRVCLAIASVAPLHQDWQAMVDGSRTAIQVANDIETHDSIATDALKAAGAGRYDQALATYAGATTAISDAAAIAGALSTVTDVSTLTNWLGRTTQMDDALQLLWRTMISSKGVVNAQVAAALRGVNSAKALLPDSNNVLAVVLYELAGNLTANGISIETAKGALHDAISQLVGAPVYGAG